MYPTDTSALRFAAGVLLQTLLCVAASEAAGCLTKFLARSRARLNILNLTKGEGFFVVVVVVSFLLRREILHFDFLGEKSLSIVHVETR